MMICILLGLTAAISFFLYWSNKAVVITNFNYSSESLPQAFDGYRITQVSDLQSQYFGRNQSVLLKKVRKTRPDIIVITGDLLDRNHTDYVAAIIAIEGLVKIAPVYYVSGNHEMATGEGEFRQFCSRMEGLGVNVLFDRGDTINKDGQSIAVMGLSEKTVFACKNNVLSNKVKADEWMLNYALAHLRRKADVGKFIVLLTHEPQYFEAYAANHFDLIFAGHAHGGQIRLPFTEGLYAPGQGVLPKLTAGKHRDGRATLFISRGLGNSTFPFRVFNRPEIVTVKLNMEYIDRND